MNIFAFHKCTESSAMDHCDKHVIKMTVEYAQILSTALRIRGVDDDTLYRATHQSGRFVKWAATNRENFIWLMDLFCDTAIQYRIRYGREHKTYVRFCYGVEFARHLPNIPPGLLTPPPLACPAHNGGKTWEEVCMSNRNYFNATKQHIAKWKFATPTWYKE